MQSRSCGVKSHWLVVKSSSEGRIGWGDGVVAAEAGWGEEREGMVKVEDVGCGWNVE